MAYAELYFTPTRWPDFTPAEFKKILEEVSQRERRFGNVGSQKNPVSSEEESIFLKESIPDV